MKVLKVRVAEWLVRVKAARVLGVVCMVIAAASWEILAGVFVVGLVLWVDFD